MLGCEVTWHLYKLATNWAPLTNGMFMATSPLTSRWSVISINIWPLLRLDFKDQTKLVHSNSLVGPNFTRLVKSLFNNFFFRLTMNVVKYRKVTSRSKSWLVAHPKIFRLFNEWKIWYIFTVTFGQKDPKLNGSLVYCSWLYRMGFLFAFHVLKRYLSVPLKFFQFQKSSRFVFVIYNFFYT